MEHPFFAGYFSDDTVRAICWTLIHSLWIGLIVAALAGLVISAGKKMSSHLRYQLLCSILLLFTGTMAFIFYRELGGEPGQPAITGLTAGKQTSILQMVTSTHGAAFSYESITGLLNRASGWIVAVWLVCFVFKGFQLTRGLLRVNRVKRQGIVALDDEWTNKVAAFARQLGIRRAVQLLESERVNIPVTIGYFKPVILLPLGMVLQLSPAQIESILYHELAHILRKDYLVNILQSMVETVFFFNPAIRWLSALIREERESCCDDIVLAHVPQKRNYLEALMVFQGYESQPAGHAMGLSLRPHQLMNRLRRMVNQENQKLSATEKIVLLSGMILLSAFTFIPKADSASRHHAAITKQPVFAITQGALLPAVKTSLPVETLPAHHRVVKNPVATTAWQDSVFHIASIKFVKTDADTANEQLYVTDDHGNHYFLTSVDSKLTSLQINDVWITDRELINYNTLLHQINQAFDKARQAKVHVMASNPSQPESGPGERNRKKLHAPTDISADQQRVRGVIASLINEKVVPDFASVDWFGLSDTELIVNGQKQPEELHQKLKAQFGVRPNFGLYFGAVKMTGTGVFLEKRDL